MEAWETDLAARTVTEKTIWAEFIVPQRDTSNMSDSSNAGDASSSSVDLAEPKLWRWYLVVPVRLAARAFRLTQPDLSLSLTLYRWL